MRGATFLLMGLAVWTDWSKAQTEFPLPAGAQGVEFKADTKGPVLARLVTGGEKVAKPYVWPVLTPSGVAVTRSWPMVPDAPGAKDHKHQKSAWFCHGDLVVEGHKPQPRKGVAGTDFWSEETGHGRIVLDSEKVAIGQAAGLNVQVNAGYVWQDSVGKPLLRENRQVQFKPIGKTVWLMDWTCQMAASEGSVTFEDTKEGSMGIRVVDALTEKEGGKLINSKGQFGEKNVWGREADWCAYAGNINGNPVAIAILDHPQNPHRACWHARGYGLMAANPFGRKKSGFPDRKDTAELVKIAKGEKLTLRYGLLVLDGDWASASKTIAEQYDVWSKAR